MKKSRYSPEQVAFGLRQSEESTGLPRSTSGFTNACSRITIGQKLLALSQSYPHPD